MLRAVERTHAPIAFVPDIEVLERVESYSSHFKQLADMPPIHADIGNRSIPTNAGCVGKDFLGRAGSVDSYHAELEGDTK